MSQPLSNKKIAALVADGFEQVELTKPKKAFEEAGAKVDIVSPNDDMTIKFKVGIITTKPIIFLLIFN